MPQAKDVARPPAKPIEAVLSLAQDKGPCWEIARECARENGVKLTGTYTRQTEGSVTINGEAIDFARHGLVVYSFDTESYGAAKQWVPPQSS